MPNVTKVSQSLFDIGLALQNDSVKNMPKTEVYKTIQTFALYKIHPHKEFMTQVEPLVLKYMEQFSPIEIAYLLSYYARMQIGTAPWLKVLISCMQNVVEVMPLKGLIEVLKSLKCNFITSGLEINTQKPALVVLNQVMKKLDDITPEQFDIVVDTLHKLNIPEKAYYELLAVKFSKIAPRYKLQKRVDKIYKLTLPKIDEASIFNKTQETLREYLSLFLYNQSLNQEGELDRLQLQLEGFLTPRQILYLQEHYTNNKDEVEKSQVLLSNLTKENHAKACEYLMEQISGFIRILW
jgi:hypothetical protein